MESAKKLGGYETRQAPKFVLANLKKLFFLSNDNFNTYGHFTK